eukprot:TRINITY_DN3747_c1_g1_i3.p1 TRINITY_DN3747_c1_g1~~TRINITY_DN3747_c1_g1_i3.p1  ORF type:complete len:666 (+),score=174.26 TRINITY_DN3747_c1_g1_i3:228-2000(+)
MVFRWLQQVLGHKPAEFAELADAQHLCQLANAIEPGVIPLVSGKQEPFANMEDCMHFVQACAKLGVAQENLFLPSDLVFSRNPSKVLATLVELGKAVSAAPREFRPAFSEELTESDVSQEDLAKAFASASAPTPHVPNVEELLLKGHIAQASEQREAIAASESKLEQLQQQLDSVTTEMQHTQIADKHRIQFLEGEVARLLQEAQKMGNTNKDEGSKGNSLDDLRIHLLEDEVARLTATLRQQQDDSTKQVKDFEGEISHLSQALREQQNREREALRQKDEDMQRIKYLDSEIAALRDTQSKQQEDAKRRKLLESEVGRLQSAEELRMHHPDDIQRIRMLEVEMAHVKTALSAAEVKCCVAEADAELKSAGVIVETKRRVQFLETELTRLTHAVARAEARQRAAEVAKQRASEEYQLACTPTGPSPSRTRPSVSPPTPLRAPSPSATTTTPVRAPAVCTLTRPLTPTATPRAVLPPITEATSLEKKYTYELDRVCLEVARLKAANDELAVTNGTLQRELAKARDGALLKRHDTIINRYIHKELAALEDKCHDFETRNLDLRCQLAARTSELQAVTSCLRRGGTVTVGKPT